MSVTLAKLSDTITTAPVLPLSVVGDRSRSHYLYNVPVPAPILAPLTTIAGLPLSKDYRDGYGFEYAVGE